MLTDQQKNRIASLMTHQKWSPELIAGRLSKDGEICVRHETIYKWIWTAKHSHHRKHMQYKNLHRHMRHIGRRQKRGNLKDNRGAIMQRVSIEQRPMVVSKLKHIGDIEVGLMMGSNHRSVLLVMTGRATLVTMLEKLECKQADHIYQKMRIRLSNFNS